MLVKREGRLITGHAILAASLVFTYLPSAAGVGPVR
jgi:hypothetical protein